MFFEFDDAKLFAVEEQFMVGPSLLITPVLHEGKAVVTGYFPSSDGTTWRDWNTGEVRSLCPMNIIVPC
jgi:alpha-glucosidase (family GH31 glycosyl hydrolase)